MLTEDRKKTRGRDPLPPGEKLELVRVFVKPKYKEQIKEIAKNLNRYGTIEAPEGGAYK